VARADIVLLATKAHQTETAADWLARLCDAKTLVAVLQNGVEHLARVEPLVGDATVVPCIVDCPSTRSAPGRVRVTRPFEALFPDSEGGRRCADLLAGAGLDTRTTADFVTAAWKKLCVNVISGPIPALCDQPRGVFRHPPITELCRTLVRECLEVGRAEGAELRPELVEQIVARRCNGPPDAVTSMLRDRRAGRVLEADSRNGAVVRAGQRHGIATPANAVVAAVLDAVNRRGLDL
jgi:2-dehydropantoate 2-reductase